MTARAQSAEPTVPVVPWRNAVTLCGRLTALPEPVALPSGDPLWRFRVAVERPPARRARSAPVAERRVVDAVDCATTTRRVTQRLQKLPVGAVVEVHGVLTRRFWRAPGGGPASRYEVVVTEVSVVPGPAL